MSQSGGSSGNGTPRPIRNRPLSDWFSSRRENVLTATEVGTFGRNVTFNIVRNGDLVTEMYIRSCPDYSIRNEIDSLIEIKDHILVCQRLSLKPTSIPSRSGDMCVICYDNCDGLVVTPCCYQGVCLKTINLWLKEYSNCPYCRNFLTLSQLLTIQCLV